MAPSGAREKVLTNRARRTMVGLNDCRLGLCEPRVQHPVVQLEDCGDTDFNGVDEVRLLPKNLGEYF